MDESFLDKALVILEDSRNLGSSELAYRISLLKLLTKLLEERISDGQDKYAL